MRSFLLTLLFPAALATSSYLVGYSTGRHFSCPGTSCSPSNNAFSEAALSALLNRLGSPSSHSDFDLPISADFATQKAPEITLVVESNAGIDFETLLEKLSSAATSDLATSFVLHTDKLTSKGELHSISQLKTLTASKASTLYTNGQQDVLRVSVGASDIADIMDIIHVMKNRASGDIAITWSGLQLSAGGLEKQEENAKADEQGNDVQKEEPKSEEKPDENVMRPPEISEGGVAGLIVGFVFLLLFIPGFMCLWNIQTPQTFEMIDSTEMKKKMQ